MNEEMEQKQGHQKPNIVSKLVIISRKGEQEFILESENVTIGSEPDNTIILEGTSPHAVNIEKIQDGYRLKNLSLPADLKVNGKEVTGEKILEKNDEIVINDNILHFFIEVEGRRDRIGAQIKIEPPKGEKKRIGKLILIVLFVLAAAVLVIFKKYSAKEFEKSLVINIEDYVGYSTEDAITGDLCFSDITGDRKPEIFLLSRDKNLYCFNPSEGNAAWQKKLDSEPAGFLSKDPDGRLFFFETSGKFSGVDIKTGNTVWSKEMNLPQKLQCINLPKGKIVLASKENSILCLSSENGRILWEKNLLDRGDITGLVFIKATNEIWAVQKSGYLTVLNPDDGSNSVSSSFQNDMNSSHGTVSMLEFGDAFMPIVISLEQAKSKEPSILMFFSKGYAVRAYRDHWEHWKIPAAGEISDTPAVLDSIESRSVFVPSGKGELQEYNYENMQMVWSFKIGGQPGKLLSPVFCDLTGDLKKEIIIFDDRGHTWVLEGNKKNLILEQEKNIPVSTEIFLEDITGEGNPEIVFGSSNGALYIFKTSRNSSSGRI